MPAKDVLTVRVSRAQINRLMRVRKARTQTELIQTLLDEEDERITSHAVLRRFFVRLQRRKVPPFDDRLL
jgi:hypothetical protein